MARKERRARRRLVPLSAVFGLILFSYPSCAVGVLAAVAAPGKRMLPLVGVPSVLLGCGMLVGGLLALPPAPRQVMPAAVLLAAVAAVAILAGVSMIWNGESALGGGALCAFAAPGLGGALLLFRAARKARRR
jgi:hypothetical protein